MRIFIYILFVAAAVLVFPPNIIAQHEKQVKIDRDGEFHLDTKTIVDGKVLEPGMYRLGMVFVNGQPVVIFSNVAMNRWGKSMWPSVRSEILRTRVKSLPTEARRDGPSAILVVRRSENPRRQFALEIRYKGQSFIYRFTSNTVPPGT